MTRRNHHRREHPATTLDSDEQAELATKIRYGIGLEQLLGEDEAARVRRERTPQPLRREPPPTREAPHPPRSDEQVRVRANKLGLGVGTRGRWLTR